MLSVQFKAYSVANEIDLNKLAIECGISKKYTWEEPLVLQGATLEKILGLKADQNEKVMLFSFGSVVFINLSEDRYPKFMEYLKQFKPEIDMTDWAYYQDDYALHIADEEIMLTDEYAVVSQFQPFYPEMVAIVLAKSVALERVEEHLGQILDSMESLIERLEKGNLHIGDKKLARTTAKVARHEYNSISYIMILDKPDITWANSEAENFYEKMSIFFELNDRYEIIKSKTEVLNNIITGFSSISHSLRGLWVELIILLLIVVEVVLMFLELFK